MILYTINLSRISSISNVGHLTLIVNSHLYSSLNWECFYQNIKTFQLKNSYKSRFPHSCTIHTNQVRYWRIYGQKWEKIKRCHRCPEESL
jgi:hypothetical protein